MCIDAHKLEIGDIHQSPGYIYVVVRKDISKAQQIVQSCHACFESGYYLAHVADNVHLVLLSCENTKHLNALSSFLDMHGVKYKKFFEPDDNLGYTALCTEVLSGDKRKLFRKCNLWTP